jgi:hypothetical protein
MSKYAAILTVGLVTVMSLWLSAQAVVAEFDKKMLEDPIRVGKEFEQKFNSVTVTKFVPDSLLDFVILKNGYSRSKIVNTSAWPPKVKKYNVLQVQIVYTQYPKDKDFWLTNYHELLAARLKELFALDSTLNDSRIDWTMVLQTACKNEKEAEKMFHGIIIYYTPVIGDTAFKISKVFTRADSINYAKGYIAVQKFVKESLFAKERRESDSTAFKVFDRHKDWGNCLVVCDWTASMYAYSSYVALWHSLNYKRSGIRYVSLFNDGGNKSDLLKRTGKVNGVFYCDSYDIKHLVKLYKDVIANGAGGAEPENDIEAILRSIKHYPDAKEIVLVADNSCIRDFCLVGKISKPVKVILVGTKEGINPQYINLAYRTGGSIHTIAEDIEDLRKRSADGVEIKLQGFEFIFDSKKNGYDFKASKPEEVPDCTEYNTRRRTED